MCRLQTHLDPDLRQGDVGIVDADRSRSMTLSRRLGEAMLRMDGRGLATPPHHPRSVLSLTVMAVKTAIHASLLMRGDSSDTSNVSGAFASSLSNERKLA